jgi:hypothetical protein
MLAAGLRAEVAGYIDAHADEVDDKCRRHVVRNGHHSEPDTVAMAWLSAPRRPARPCQLAPRSLRRSLNCAQSAAETKRTRADEATATRTETPTGDLSDNDGLAVLLAAAAGDPNDILAATTPLSNHQVETLAAAYEQLLREQPGLPEGYRVWCSQLAEGLRSILHWRGIEERHLLRDLDLPVTWDEVAAFAQRDADEEPS